MELPRIASQTSICPPSIQFLLTDLGNTSHHNYDQNKSRKPASERLLSNDFNQLQDGVAGNGNGNQQQVQQQMQQQQQEPQFAILPAASHYQPSRKREEARALQNLRRRLQQVRVLQANKAEPIEATSANNNLSPEDIDNRPHLLQKILTNRPVSMILDMAEIRTAWQDSDFITDCLCWHNVYRQAHGSPPLTMSSELCHLAQTWANHLAHTNRFYYRNDKDIGQNLFCRHTNVLVTDVTGQEVTTYWYHAVKQYDFNKEPDILHANVNAGHFTQLVWAGSRHCGVGKARSRSGKILVVAHYYPAGNISGSYLENVLPPCGEYTGMSAHPPIPPPRRFVSIGSTPSTETSTRSSSSRRSS